jgi:hypothetical protein
VIKIGSRREEFPVRESKCVGLLIMFVKPLIEKKFPINEAKNHCRELGNTYTK